MNIHFKLILAKLNLDTFCFEIIDDPDQLASLIEEEWSVLIYPAW